MESRTNRAKSSWLAKAVLVLLWLNFALFWFRVNRVTDGEEMRDSLGYLGVLSVLYLVILASWIYHNVRIYRQKGPRRYVRRVPFDGSHDLLNRAISHETDLMGGQEIYVTVAGNRKAFVDASCVEAD